MRMIKDLDKDRIHGKKDLNYKKRGKKLKW